jgi:hypothetical protein
MHYVTLGNLGFCTPNNSNPSGCTEQTGWDLTNTGPFSLDESHFYWSGTVFDPLNQVHFDFFSGVQGNVVSCCNFAWAVRTGDVPAVVPVPAAVWLFGSGLLGLIGMAKRNKA